jgi:hypothetical protein
MALSKNMTPIPVQTTHALFFNLPPCLDRLKPLSLLGLKGPSGGNLLLSVIRYRRMLTDLQVYFFATA